MNAPVNPPDWVGEIRWSQEGLVPAVIQDHASGKVLMLAWMNRESLLQSLARRQTVFWSRSRRCLWHKGETSGHVQHIKTWRLDCDGDTLLIGVEQEGGIACHTGAASCFYRSVQADE